MKKIVLKLDVLDDRIKQKAMKSVSVLPGVDSVYVNMIDKNLTVTGDVDPVDVVLKLRKICHAELLSVDSYGFKKILELDDILSATNNFSYENLIKEGALGKVYKGQLLWYEKLRKFIVHRLDCKNGQGEELQTEISIVNSLRNKNIASVYWCYYKNNENILVYKASNGTLNQHLSDTTLTWYLRLQICLGVARGLNHIHYDVIHCDINSSKIILDKNWEPKIYGFEVSTEYPQSWRHRLLFSSYFNTDNLTPKYDVYSFGVLLLEVLCGRKPTITNYVVEDELYEMIDPILRKQMDKQSLELFTNIAYKCLNQQQAQRPTMDQIVKELTEVLEVQLKHKKNDKHSKAGAEEGTPSHVDLLEIPLSKIRLATKNFNSEYLVGAGGYGEVYRAKLELGNISKTVAIKRIFSRADEQGKQGFDTELELLKCCKHQNIVSLLGFSSEALQMILVYEYAFKGSLSGHLVGIGEETVNLTWVQRIQICLDIAFGISYLHTDMEGKPRIIHRDIKSDNILLDENMNAKIADFGLSKFHPTNQQASTIHSKTIAGTHVYLDPEYLNTGKYKRESDIYSFGVVLFEVLSGSLAYDLVYINENEMGLAPIARRRYNEGTLKELIDKKIVKEDDDHVFTLNRGPNQDSFNTFSKIAYQCLADTQAKRPTIEVIIEELQNALKLQGCTMVLFRYPLEDIVSATKNFSETCYIGSDTNGMVYNAELCHFDNNSLLGTKGKNNGELIAVAVKRITDRKGRLGKQEFFEELEARAIYKHPNIVSLLGFCDQCDEMLLVFEHVSDRRSLDDYLKSVDNMDNFTWTHRLHVCLKIACGLNHLHTTMVKPRRIIKGGVKSANIHLDKNLVVKIAYFAISTNEEIGMEVSEDPDYETTRTSDIYSFGVVLFEIFCGRVAYDPIYMKENDEGLAPVARQRFNDKTIKSLMDMKLKEDISTSNEGPNEDSLDTFLEIANQCLGEAVKRPTMEMVNQELKRALNLQHVDKTSARYTV